MTIPWQKRRIILIEKKYTIGLTSNEEIELSDLQTQMQALQRLIAPLPLDTIDEYLRQHKKTN